MALKQIIRKIPQLYRVGSRRTRITCTKSPGNKENTRPYRQKPLRKVVFPFDIDLPNKVTTITVEQNERKLYSYAFPQGQLERFFNAFATHWVLWRQSHDRVLRNVKEPIPEVGG
jgi:hypothetical protein